MAGFCRARKIEALASTSFARIAGEVKWRAASPDQRSGRLLLQIMNNSELNRILKAAKAPERREEFWARFPRRVTARLHWKPALKPSSGRFWRLAWALSAVTACLVIGFMAGHWRGHEEAAAENGLLQNAKMIQETFAMFPHRVKAIVQDQHGINLVLSDKEDVPHSTPLWIKICDGKNCAAMVTFSGQEIKLGSKELTVLTDVDGKIILAGENFLWSNGDALLAGNDKLKIEAKTLAPVVL